METHGHLWNTVCLFFLVQVWLQRQLFSKSLWTTKWTIFKISSNTVMMQHSKPDHAGFNKKQEKTCALSKIQPCSCASLTGVSVCHTNTNRLYQEKANRVYDHKRWCDVFKQRHVFLLLKEQFSWNDKATKLQHLIVCCRVAQTFQGLVEDVLQTIWKAKVYVWEGKQCRLHLQPDNKSKRKKTLPS